MNRTLQDPPALAFPFHITDQGSQRAERGDHIKQQISQILYTEPGERLYHPEFGIGLQALVFEPNQAVIWQVIEKKLIAALAKALQGEVAPRSLKVKVEGHGEQMMIVISYTLARLGVQSECSFPVPGGQHG